MKAWACLWGTLACGCASLAGIEEPTPRSEEPAFTEDDEPVSWSRTVAAADGGASTNSDGCAPCKLANARSTCGARGCIIEACASGFRDCDQDPSTGCESEVLRDPENCGGCGRRCKSDESCVSGDCRN